MKKVQRSLYGRFDVTEKHFKNRVMTNKKKCVDDLEHASKRTRTIKDDGADKASPGQMAAKVSLHGLLNAPILMTNIVQVEGLMPSLQDWMEELRKTIEEVKSGETKRIEGMLIGQMYALDALFTDLTRKALKAEYMSNLETYMRLALKVQNQSRATAQSLADMKRPKHTVFAGQANISTGPQQVNNTINKSGEIESKQCCDFQKKSESEQNELLKAHEKGNRLDAGAARPSSRDDQNVETLEEGHRPKNRVRESKRSKEL